MRIHATLSLRNRPGLPLVLMATFLVVLLVAGGASRGDVAGQIVVRFAAWSVIGILALFGPIPSWKRTGPVLGFLMAMAVLALLQLVPLPPALWQALPGHELAVEASALAGQPQSWRPLSIAPSASWNALSSLIVPATILLLWAELTSEERALLPGLLTIMIALAALVGLMQMIGAGFDNPLINETSWDVRGTLANRNHFAVLLALGCMITPTWGLHNRAHRGWRTPLAIGLVLIFLLMYLQDLTPTCRG